MENKDLIKNVTIVGVGTQGSMIAFRNALYGKQVTGYSRTEESMQKCRDKIDKWLQYFISKERLTVVQAAALAHYRTLGFEPIVTEKEIKGYSINRVWRAVKKECLYLWANGYTDPKEFDRGWMLEWGTNMGPFKLMDLIGLQTIYNIENSYYNASGDECDKPPAKLKEMIDDGRLGMKTGEGFYTGYDTEAGNLEVEK